MSLAVSGYVRQFYKGNLFGATKNGRTGQTPNSLAMADMKAIRKAVREMGSYCAQTCSVSALSAFPPE